MWRANKYRCNCRYRPYAHVYEQVHFRRRFSTVKCECMPLGVWCYYIYHINNVRLQCACVGISSKANSFSFFPRFAEAVTDSKYARIGKWMTIDHM